MYSLYGPGWTHIVNGTPCQLIRVEERDLAHYRCQGFVDNIADLNKPAEAVVVQDSTKKTRGKNKPAEVAEEQEPQDSTVGENSNDIQDENTDS